MSADIGVTGRITGVGEVRAALGALPKDRIARVRRAVRAEGIGLASYIKKQKLSGQVLNVQTGRLRGSINDQYAETGSSASSQVGTGVSYARPWELGFVGFVTVRAHLRAVKSRSTFRTERTAEGKRRRVKLSEGIAFVREHQRFVHMMPRPFLAPALAERRAAILAKLEAAVHGKGP